MDTSQRPATTALITTALTAAIGCLVLAGCAAPATRATAPATAPVPVTSAPVTALPVTAAPTVAPATPAVTVAAPVVTAPVAVPDPAPVKAPASAQPVSAVTVPNFGSPEAAMRYLVAAYNAHDIVSERHVTGPDARASLEGERKWVNTFRFDHCDSAGGSQYWCVFDMVSKVAATTTTTTTTVTGGDNFGNDLQSMGEITVLVAPAGRPGWYMAGNLGCGD